jgi:hypothetical protein
MSAPPEFLTAGEAAELLRVNVKTLRRWATGRRPSIPCVVIGQGERRTLRFHRPTIIAAAGGREAKP